MQDSAALPTPSPQSGGLAAPESLLALLWRARYRLLAAALLAAALAGGYRLVRPRTYQSAATLIFPAGGATSRLASLAGAGGGDLPAVPLMEGLLSIPQIGTAPDTAVVLLRSRKAVAALIDQFQFEWSKGVPAEVARQQFLKRFACVTGRAGDLQIAFEDESPKTAQAVVATAINNLEDAINEMRLDPAARSISYLRQKIARTEADFQRAQEELASFQERHAGAPPDQRLQWLGQRLSDVEGELGRTEVEAEAATSRARLSSRLAEGMLRSARDPKADANSLLATQYRVMVEAEAKLAVLRKTYTSQHAEVISAQRALDAARKSLREEINRQVSGVGPGESPYVSEAVVAAAAARARADGLRRSSQKLRQELASLPREGAEYARLLLEVETTRKLLATLAPELEKAQVAAESESLRFVVVDPPVVPGVGLPRRTLLTAVAGFVVGLLLMAIGPYVQWVRQNYDHQRQLESQGARPSGTDA